MFKFLKGPIYNKVAQVLETRIANAEEEHEKHCGYLDEVFDQKVDDLETQLDADKDKHSEQMVSKILGN